MVIGCRHVKESGLRVPPVIRIATDQFFFDKNELEAFLMECTETVPGARVSKADLYAAYCAWCILEAHEPRTQREFGRLLRTVYKLDEDRGTNGTRYWKGIRLKEAVNSYLPCDELVANSFIDQVERHWARC